MNPVRQCIKGCCSALLPRRMFLAKGPSLNGGGDGGCPEIALTFDDGPDPRTTPQLLDLLDDRGIVATFFLIGEKAAQYRDIVKRIVGSGHDLGNHSFTHSDPKQTSTAKFLDEVRRTKELLEEIAGRPCRLVRPPKGSLSMGKQLGLWRAGMTIVLWSVDPRDYRMESTAQAEAWGAAYRPRGGDIVLLHDNHRWALTVVGTIADNMHEGRFVRLSKWT